MFKNKKISYFFIMIPLLLLLLLGIYFGAKFFNQYLENKVLQKSFKDATLLDKYELTVLNEILTCSLLHNKNTDAMCKANQQKRSVLLNTLKDAKPQFKQGQKSVDALNNGSCQKKIDNFESYIGKKKLAAISGPFLHNLNDKIKSQKLKYLIKLYTEVSDAIYASELEKFLVSYYVTTKVPVSMMNTIFWDKINQSSVFPKDDSTELVENNQLFTTLKNDTYYALLSKIDDMRIAILTGNINKATSKGDWVNILVKKLTYLENFQGTVTKEIDTLFTKKIDDSLSMLLFSLVLAFLAMSALLLVYIKMRNEKRDEAIFVEAFNKMNALIPRKVKETSIMKKALSKAETKEYYYEYMYEGVELLQNNLKSAMNDSKEKTHFLSTLSHEIRTPLNGIIGFTKLLRDMGVTSDQEEFLSLIEGSSQNLISIVNDILDLSKMDADKMKLENVSFNIVKTIESTVSRFVQQADQKDIELGIFIDPFLPHHYFGDATKLSQVLTNLISNALKFTQSYGKINVFVQSVGEEGDEAQIKFAVNDSGIGLSDDERQNIFNAFAQANNGLRIDQNGTGLGLAISRQMVALMGGKLDVTSKLNQGSSFYFTLTLKRDNSKETKPAPNFSGVEVGLALPVRGLKRQLDTNLETYMRYLGVTFTIYYYEDLFEGMGFVNLPDIMIFDHHYARLDGELEMCLSLDCKSVLLTNAVLYPRINRDIHSFDDILFRPVGLNKCIRILSNVREIETETEELEDIESLKTVASFEGLSALVADDNDINRKLIKIILEKLGLDVVLANDGNEAVAQYEKRKFDIIFMDIEMPGLDGVEATKQILAHEMKQGLSHVPIVALTANAVLGDEEYYLSMGMDAYTKKPLDVEILKQIIKDECVDKKKTKENEEEEDIVSVVVNEDSIIEKGTNAFPENNEIIDIISEEEINHIKENIPSGNLSKNNPALEIEDMILDQKVETETEIETEIEIIDIDKILNDAKKIEEDTHRSIGLK